MQRLQDLKILKLIEPDLGQRVAHPEHAPAVEHVEEGPAADLVAPAAGQLGTARPRPGLVLDLPADQVLQVTEAEVVYVGVDLGSPERRPKALLG